MGKGRAGSMPRPFASLSHARALWSGVRSRCGAAYVRDGQRDALRARGATRGAAPAQACHAPTCGRVGRPMAATACVLAARGYSGVLTGAGWNTGEPALTVAERFIAENGLGLEHTVRSIRANHEYCSIVGCHSLTS